MNQEQYLDPSQPGSFSGLRSYYHGLGKNKVDKEDIKKWFQSNDSYTFHFPTKSKFKRNKIRVTGIDKLWQADLADFSNIASSNDGIKYVFICIDVFSKFLMVETMTKKDAPSSLTAFKTILQKSKRKPLSLQTDDGKEFVNKQFQSFLKENNINFYTIKSENKACVAERVIRTLKEKIYRYMTHLETDRFIDNLQNIVNSYNHSYHSTIKMAPCDVDKTNEEKLWEDQYLFYDKKPLKFKFQVGDHVRLANANKVFKKGYLRKWTEEMFVVSECLPRAPPVYRVKDINNEDIQGIFYEQELQKVINTGVYKIEEVLKTRKKGKKIEYLVKWRGYPDSFNSWVSNLE